MQAPLYSGSCPDSNLINKYLLEQTEFEGNLSKFSEVCFCQLQILKETSLSSKDPDLSQLITSLKGKQSAVKNATDAAMLHTSVFVAELLLQGESLLLPTAHAFFDKIAQELMSKHDLSDDDTNVSFTSRFLENLLVYQMMPTTSWTGCLVVKIWKMTRKISLTMNNQTHIRIVYC